MKIRSVILCAAAAAGLGMAQEAVRPFALTAVCADAEISDFGLVCSAEEPCPVYLEISSVEPLGAKIFLSGNLHTNDATLWSVLLASEDGGKTWSEPHPRIRGCSLDQVQFVDFQNGWASGQSGGVLPKDPFLLSTTDGGKTWRRMALFEDTAYGFIEQFWFDSKTHGALVLNRKGSPGGRYLKLETVTGGESWMARGTSAAPVAALRSRGATSSNADWRVRTDAAAKAFRVERREAGKWISAGLFPVRAGVCKPAPPQETAPPPTSAEKPAEAPATAPAKPAATPPAKPPAKQQ